MKKLSKNKFAKLFATFLGASTILTPIATLVSCEQLNKTPVTQEKPTPTPNPGEISDPSQTPKPIDGTLTTIEGTTITIQLVKENNIVKVEILGNIPSNKLTEIFTTLDKDTYKNKTISSNSKLNIKTKNQTLKIKISDLKELLKKLPIKIDNEETITIDKDANITSIKGNINLTDITQNVSNNDELTIAQFINKQIQEGTTQIKSDGLEIQSKETDKIQTNNLKKVTKKLSKTYITNTTSNGTQTVTLDKDANITSVTGNISLKDVTENNNEEETEIAKYIAKKLKENSDTNFDSSNLTINTFYKKTTGRGAPSRDSSQEYTYESTPITPKFLKETEQNALNKAVLNFKDSNEVMHVKFESYQGETEEQKQSDYFDITEFYNEVKSGKLKNIPSKVEGNIFLRGERDLNMIGNEDHTNYPRAEELVSLIKKFNNNKIVTVGSVYIAGTLNELLPYLLKINGKPQIEKNYGDIKIVNYYNTKCYETGYKNGKLLASHLQEYYNRAKHNAMRIMDTTIENLDSTNYTGDFIGDMLTRVNFQGGDLSKISFSSCMTGGGYLKFENTILPTNMGNSVVGTLILKNAKLPEELKETDPEDLPYRLPKIDDNLKIFNLELLNKWTEEDLSKLDKVRCPPKKYVGPRDIWNKLKLLFLNGETETQFTNADLTGSIQKQQSQLLALLQTQNKSRG